MNPRKLLQHDPALLTESQWASVVNELASIGGWRRYHTYLSKRSPKGFPDLVLVRPPRLIFAELKTNARTSRTTPEQDEWLHDLVEVQVATGGVVEAHVWRPSDWPSVVEVLTGRPPATRQAA